ncbi:MAG: hypothetical protein WCL50_12970 [Spirochaetota bacterium]
MKKDGGEGMRRRIGKLKFSNPLFPFFSVLSPFSPSVLSVVNDYQPHTHMEGI